MDFVCGHVASECEKAAHAWYLCAERTFQSERKWTFKHKRHVELRIDMSREESFCTAKSRFQKYKGKKKTVLTAVKAKLPLPSRGNIPDLSSEAQTATKVECVSQTWKWISTNNDCYTQKVMFKYKEIRIIQVKPKPALKQFVTWKPALQIIFKVVLYRDKEGRLSQSQEHKKDISWVGNEPRRPRNEATLSLCKLANLYYW